MVKKQLEIYETIIRRAKRPKTSRDGVTLCGAYGRGNAGDDAILEAVVSEMRSIDPDIPVRVLSRRPKQTEKGCRVQALYTFNAFSFLRALCRSRVFLNGGGSLIQDVTSRRSLLFYLYTIRLAALCGCKVMMYGCGIGPVRGRLNRKLAARVINNNVSVVTLREDDSLWQLKEMGVSRPNIFLSADPALTIRPAPEETVDSLMISQGMAPDGRYIGFALRRWPGFEGKIPVFSRAAQYAYEKYGLTPVFIPIEKKADMSAAQAVAGGLSCPCHILTDMGGNASTVGVLSRMQVMVAMRLHALILTAGQGVPMIGIVYDPKVNGFLRYIGQDLYMPLDEADDASLKTCIDEAAVRRGDPQPLRLAVERLLQWEKTNTEQAAILLGKPMKD